MVLVTRCQASSIGPTLHYSSCRVLKVGRGRAEDLTRPDARNSIVKRLIGLAPLFIPGVNCPLKLVQVPVNRKLTRIQLRSERSLHDVGGCDFVDLGFLRAYNRLCDCGLSRCAKNLLDQLRQRRTV